jgi:hypothetical protein
VPAEPVGCDPVAAPEPSLPAVVGTGAPVPGVGVEAVPVADPLEAVDPAPEEPVAVVPVPDVAVPEMPGPEAPASGDVPVAAPVEVPETVVPVPDVPVPELVTPVVGSVVEVPGPAVAIPPDGSLLTIGEVVATVPAVGSIEVATVGLVVVAVVSADAQPGATSTPGAASVTATGKSLRADRTGRDGFERMRADALFDIDQFLARYAHAGVGCADR